MPIPGDPRAWDATLQGRGWRVGVEAETGPRDGQALIRRIELKRRDSGAEGAILLVPRTRRIALFMREAGPLLMTNFPIPGTEALERIAAGESPGGSAVVRL